MLAQAAAPMVTGAATYSDELQGAYDYAYSKGITTMTSIDNANMYGELTRGQLSKMISQWAEKEMWVKADETASCSFSDASTAEGDLATWVVKACQMGLMGQGINAFRPNDKVTRGEFGTVLSRAIWGDKYNQENPFYAKHLQALKDAGIMTKIEEPNSLEIRGWVMLMLQRAAETVSGDDECNDPAVLLACALGSTGCPAKCAEKESEKSTINPYEGVQAGDLNIAVSTSSSVTSIPYKGVIKVAELAVKASENIQLQTIDVSRLGLAANKGIKVWIEKDGKRITSSSSLFWDASATLTFNNNGYVVNGNETLDLIVSLDGTQTAGAELQFKVGNLVSSAKSTSISPDTTGVFRTTTYEATSLTAEWLEVTNNYDLADDVEFSFGELKVINDSKASDERNVLIRNITFKLDEGNFDNLGNFKLTRDSKEVSSKYTIDGKSLTFTVNDQLDSGKSAVYKVIGKPTNVEKTGGDDYRLILNKDADLIAEEIGSNASAFRVSVNITKKSATTYKNILWNTKISGGNFTLTKDSNFTSTVNVNWWYSDAVIAKGTFKANQAVKYDGFKLDLKAPGLTAPASFTGVVRRATLKIGSRQYQLESTVNGLETESEIYVDKGSHNVELQVSLITNPDTNEAGVTSFQLKDIDADAFLGGKYLNTDETNIAVGAVAGSIRSAKVSIAEEKMGLKKDGPADDVKIAQGNTDEKAVLEGTITNTTDKELSISKLSVFATNYTATALHAWADVYVLLGDKTSSRVSYTAAEFGTTTSATTGTARDVSISKTLAAGESVKFTLYVMPKAWLQAWDQFRFDVTVEGKSEGNTLWSSVLKSALVKVNPGATVTTVAQTAKNKVIFPGVSTEIASFDYTVENDNAEVKTFTIIPTDNYFSANDLNDLTIDFGGKVGAPALSYESVGTGLIVATFNSIQSIPEGKYNVKVYATFEESAIRGTKVTGTTTGDYIVVEPKRITGLAFADWNGNDKGTVDYATSKEITHIIAKAYPVLNRESFSRDKDAPSLEIGVTKVEKDNTSAVVAISKVYGDYSGNTAGADVDLLGSILKKASNALDIENISTSKGLLRGSEQKIAVSSITFTVKAGNDTVAVYDEKSSDTIADFATLTNE